MSRHCPSMSSPLAGQPVQAGNVPCALKRGRSGASADYERLAAACVDKDAGALERNETIAHEGNRTFCRRRDGITWLKVTFPHLQDPESGKVEIIPAGIWRRVDRLNLRRKDVVRRRISLLHRHLPATGHRRCRRRKEKNGNQPTQMKRSEKGRDPSHPRRKLRVRIQMCRSCGSNVTNWPQRYQRAARQAGARIAAANGMICLMALKAAA